MSWEINFDLYEKNGDNWKNIFHDKNYNAFKNFSEYRCDISLFSKAKLEKDDEITLKDLLKEYNYTNYEYVGAITKESYANLDVKTHIELDGKEQHIVISDEDKSKIKEISIPVENYIKMSTEERNSLISLCVVRTEERGNGNGAFYRVDTFYDILKTEKEKYLHLLEQKFRYENLKFSIDYLKLEEEERERVCEEINSNCENLVDDISETEQKLSALNGMISIMEIALQDGDDAVVYIYSE